MDISLQKGGSLLDNRCAVAARAVRFSAECRRFCITFSLKSGGWHCDGFCESPEKPQQDAPSNVACVFAGKKDDLYVFCT